MSGDMEEISHSSDGYMKKIGLGSGLESDLTPDATW